MTPALVLLCALAAPPTDPPRDPARPPAAPAAEEMSGERELLTIRRVFVDRLSGGETAAQIRDLLIAALQSAKLFVITENEDRADAFLRGSAEDLLYTDKFSSSEGIGARVSTGEGQSRAAGTTRGGRYGGVSLSDNESVHIEERKHEAMATVRLVNKDGDVIWSTTQESTGAKFRGASADVADKVRKQLVADYERVRKAQKLP
jgi:hypothetical protein